MKAETYKRAVFPCDKKHSYSSSACHKIRGWLSPATSQSMAETFELTLGMGGSHCPDSLSLEGPHYDLVGDARVTCVTCGSVFDRVSS